MADDMDQGLYPSTSSFPTSSSYSTSSSTYPSSSSSYPSNAPSNIPEASIDQFFASFERQPQPLPQFAAPAVGHRQDPRLAAAAPMQQQQHANSDYEKQILLEQVMSLSEEDLLQLPSDKRAQMMQLKMQLMRGTY